LRGRRRRIDPVLPYDVEPDIAEVRIAIVAMSSPTAGAQIHFNVSGARSIRADLQHGPAKIRPAFQVGESRMKHPHAFPGHGFKFAAPETLVLPDCLDEPLGREPFIAQTVFAANTGPPLGVKIIGKSSHAPLLLEFWR
jgi:hypothetical protein